MLRFAFQSVVDKTEVTKITEILAIHR